jgi:hypothetical protein
VLALLSTPITTGCRSSEARRREAEAAALAHVIDALRDAPNPGKSAALDRLRNTACEDPEVCGLKTACVAAYERHLSALGASDQARALLAQPDGGTQAALAAAAELNRAESELEQAHTLADSCASAQGQLTRKLKAK